MPNHIQNRLQIIGTSEQAQKVKSFLAGKYEDGATRTMDFNNITPMPKGMSVELHSGIETWVQICTGQISFKSALRQAGKSFGSTWQYSGFDSMINSMKASTALKTLLGEGGQNVKDMSEKDFEVFVQCLKNYREHGHNSWYEWSIKNWGTKWNAYQNPDERDTEFTIHFQTAWSSPVELMEKMSLNFPDISFLLSYADKDAGSNVGKILIQKGIVKSEEKPANGSKEAYELFFELHPSRKSDFILVDGTYQYADED